MGHSDQAVSRSQEGVRVAVTGAAGFIGQHLVERLVREGAEVHGFVRRSPGEGSEGVHWMTGDLSDLDFVAKSLRAIRPELVFHLASTVVGARDRSLILPTLHDNLITTVNLLSACTELGATRLVLAGSMEEPEPGSQDISSSPYAAAKRAATDYARMFHRLYGTAVSIARIFMVYGPNQKDLRKLVPYVALSLLRGQAPALSSGTRAVDWVYVDDVVDGLLHLAASSCTDGLPVDLGSGRLQTVRDIVDTLVQIIDPHILPQFGAQPDRPDEQIRRADIQSSFERIGWTPTVSLSEGLTRTVRWYDQARRAGRLERISA